MLVDTLPATHQHLPASKEIRDQWVDSQLIGVMMDNASLSLLAAMLSMPVLVVLLAGEAHTPLLVVWAVLLTAILVHNYRLIGLYRFRYDSVGGPMRSEFIRTYAWSWAVAGLLWGASVGLTFEQTSVRTQFVVGLVVLGQGMISITAFSTNLLLFRRYTTSLFGSILVGLLVPFAWLPWLPEKLRLLVGLVVLLLIFWWLLRQAGDRLHQVHRASFELQFSNQELIDSLTLQTRAALRAVASKNRFLASAAHDLRQPVHALSLYAEWLLAEPEMARDIAPRILQSTHAVNELFDSLFDLARIDAGNFKVRLQLVDVRQLFADMVSQFEPLASKKSIQLRTRTRPLTIWTDPVVLRRMLGNLISNALRHTQQGGVLLGLRQRSDMLVFEVWDTGIGIARENQQAIFQEFFRVSQHQGTEDSLGLGLTIVSKLATLMGYQLALSSEPGRGSVFRVMLPAFTQRGAGPAGRPEKPAAPPSRA